MCDVISFATPLDGFRERGFVGVTHGSCSGKRVSSYLPLCEIGGIYNIASSWNTVGGGVEISTLLSAALSALQNF